MITKPEVNNVKVDYLIDVPNGVVTLTPRTVNGLAVIKAEPLVVPLPAFMQIAGEIILLETGSALFERRGQKLV